MKILVKKLGLILITGTLLLLMGHVAKADEVPPQQADKLLELERRIEKLEKSLNVKNEVPLDKPNMNSKEVLNWATQVAVDAYSLNFLNFKKKLEDLRIKFTQPGYENFMKTYYDIKNVMTIELRKLVYSVVLDGTPIILKEGELSTGRYGYTVKVPLFLTQYKSTDEQSELEEVSKTKFFVIMTITRTPIVNCPDGIGISSYEATVINK